jgi:DNA-binding transcriptional MerR regulator
MTSTNRSQSVQLFEPDPQTVYTIDAAEQIAHVPRRSILVYYRHGLVTPVADPDSEGYYFDDEAIRALRRIEYLHNTRGINLEGIKIIFHLMGEVERMRSELRFLRL